MRTWLKSNQHVRTVTRDRASAYTKAIEEELPDAIQVADRFHLHQNLLDVIRKSLNCEIPASISIAAEDNNIKIKSRNKKIPCIVDNLS